MTWGPMQLRNKSTRKVLFTGEASPAPSAVRWPGIEHTMLAFTPATPDLVVQDFPITAVDTLARTLTIAGDHGALFPAGATCSIYGSTGNDTSGVAITDTAVAGGNTTVTLPEGSVTDGTVDGVLGAVGRAGVVVADLAAGDCVLLSHLQGGNEVPWDGTTPQFAVTHGTDPYRGSSVIANLSLSIQSVSEPSGTVPPDVLILDGDGGPIIISATSWEILRALAPTQLYAYVDNSRGANPHAMVGESVWHMFITRAAS